MWFQTILWYVIHTEFVYIHNDLKGFGTLLVLVLHMSVNVNMALFTCLFHYVPDDQMLIKNKFLYVTRYNHVCKSPYEVCAVKMRLYTNRTNATTKKNVGFLTVMPLGRKVLGIVDAWNNLNGKRESVEAPPHPPPFHPETTRGLLIQLEKNYVVLCC